jgi:rubrerythrin
MLQSREQWLYRKEIMPMIGEKTAQAMKTAIEMEKSGHRFFTEASNKVRNEAGRRVFARLAQEEMVHLKTFEKIFDEVSGGTEWKEALRSVAPGERVPYFDDARKQFKTDDMSIEMQYLKRALDLEREAMAFFEKAMGEAESPEAREIFRRIYEEEKLHYDLIQAEIDSVDGSGFWFDIPEFKMDGKF